MVHEDHTNDKELGFRKLGFCTSLLSISSVHLWSSLL